MPFSVFTPTHRPDHLEEAFRSLVAQTCADWEWVIVPNGPTASLPDRLASDARIRVIEAPDDVSRLGVGALKRFACERCAGDYFVELDHDDLLAPDALTRIAEAARRSGAGFLYSDFANFRVDGTCEVYDNGYGWESYPAEYDGRRYTALRAFDADASSLQQIYFAPNHVRVWSREGYARAGAHDAAMGVVDDYDLLCRTYLAGVEFHHIPECLYFYRLLPDGRNTYVQRNAEIQQRQQEISNRYVYALIAEWCRRQQLPMVDLGDAVDCPLGYRSLQLDNANKAAAPGDSPAMQSLRILPDGAAGCIRAYGFLEYVPLCRDGNCRHGIDGARVNCVVGVMNELYRVLAPGGWLLCRVPSTDGRGAFQNPAQLSFWNVNSFWYYTNREQARRVPGNICRFQQTRIWQTFPTEWHMTHDIAYVYADLVALKGQRQPGRCDI